MPSSNFKLFDENKQNMISDEAYNVNTQRLNGVQQGIASSQLQNKSMYQTSLMAYALAQMMVQQGIDADDSEAVADFVSHLRSGVAKTALDECFSKVQSLSTTTAQKFVSDGISVSAPDTPDEALAALCSGLAAANTDIGTRAKIALVSWTGDGTNSKTVTIGFKPLFVIAWRKGTCRTNVLVAPGSSYGGNTPYWSSLFVTDLDLVQATYGGIFYNSGEGRSKGEITSVTDTSITFSATGSSPVAEYAFNKSSESYYLIAIG